MMPQIRAGRPRPERASVEAQMKSAIAGSGQNPYRQPRVVTVQLRQLVCRTDKIIGNPILVQLPTGPIQPCEVGGQADDLSLSNQDRLEDSRCQQSWIWRSRLIDQFMIKRRSSGSDQRRRLLQAFIPLPHRHAIDRDPAADTELEVTIGELEAPDDHIEISAGHWAGQTDGSGVCLTGFGLQLGDPLLCRDLGRTRDRSRWKGGIKHLTSRHLPSKLTAHRRNEMPDAGM